MGQVGVDNGDNARADAELIAPQERDKSPRLRSYQYKLQARSQNIVKREIRLIAKNFKQIIKSMINSNEPSFAWLITIYLGKQIVRVTLQSTPS